jgi:hypothetical protein
VHSSRSRRSRAAGVVAVAIASLVAFASLGGVGLAQSAIGLAQYQYGKKITICHKGKNTIRISVRAWPAHKRHGDTEGACVTKTAKKQGKPSKEHGKNAAAPAGSAPSQNTADHRGNGKGNGKGNSK